MQLALGARIGTDLETAGAPQPAPKERWRLGERGRRVLRRAAWASALLGIALLGALHGATVAIGADGVGELASAPPREAETVHGAHADKELRGTFWRPERSSAERPPAEIAPRHWRPQRSH
jgi:hypothetical protein